MVFRLSVTHVCTDIKLAEAFYTSKFMRAKQVHYSFDLGYLFHRSTDHTIHSFLHIVSARMGDRDVVTWTCPPNINQEKLFQFCQRLQIQPSIQDGEFTGTKKIS